MLQFWLATLLDPWSFDVIFLGCFLSHSWLIHDMAIMLKMVSRHEWVSLVMAEHGTVVVTPLECGSHGHHRVRFWYNTTL